jgi:hypothetical protein
MSKAAELAQIFKEVTEQEVFRELSDDNQVKIAETIFINTNKSAAKQWPAKTGAATSPDGATRVITGILSSKNKENKVSKENKPYTKFTYNIGGTEYNTVSKEVAAALSTAVVSKSMVEVTLTKKGNFENMTSARVIPSALESAGNGEEDGDDIPF